MDKNMLGLSVSCAQGPLPDPPALRGRQVVAGQLLQVGRAHLRGQLRARAPLAHLRPSYRSGMQFFVAVVYLNYLDLICQRMT